jgi:hypothetical protein
VLVSEGDIAVDDRFGRESGRIYLTGIQALARLPVDSRRADLRANFNTAGFISGWAMQRVIRPDTGAITGRRDGAGSGWLRRRDPVSRVALVVAGCPAGRGPAC